MSLSQGDAASNGATYPAFTTSAGAASWPHLVVLRRGGARPPLVLISGQEGHGFGFRHLVKEFDEEQPLLALQLIGIDQDEPPDCPIEEMAAVFEVQVRAACPHGPIIVGGYSMGAAIAFELARRLRAHGREVPLLVSIDGFAPRYHRTLIPPHVHVLRHMRIALGHERTEKLKSLRKRILDVLPPSILGTEFRPGENDRRKILLSILRYRAVMQYRPVEERLPMALLLVRASHPEEFLAPRIRDPLYGWQKYIDGPVMAETIDGEHLTFIDTDSASCAIVRIITARIDEVISSSRRLDTGFAVPGAFSTHTKGA
jgi:thioesterase domain-containing protein